MRKKFIYKKNLSNKLPYILLAIIMLFAIAYGFLYKKEIRRMNNTENAMKMVVKIHSAQVRYKDIKGEFATDLESLSQYLEPSIVNAAKSPYNGYIILEMRATQNLEKEESTYCLITSPIHFNSFFSEGIFSIYIDQNGIMKVSGTEIANPNSPSYTYPTEPTLLDGL